MSNSEFDGGDSRLALPGLIGEAHGPGCLDLALARLGFLRPAERLALLAALDSEAAFAAMGSGDLELLLGRRLRLRSWDPRLLLANAARDRELAEKRGIGWVVHGSALYPPALREIPDAPALLFYRGSLPDPELPLAAVVGTRSPSAEGLKAAYEFGRDFARAGVGVVSGLALGVDALAHRGCVEGGAPSVAVLGSGPDEVYPASNRGLARRILEGGGCILSEYAPGEAPRAYHFPERNRIISGLSRALLVAEAPARSGALISADFALEQGRDVWVCASCLEGERGAGGARLAEDGAGIARCAQDLLSDWGFAASAGENATMNDHARSRSFGAGAARSLELELQFGSEPPRAERRPTGVR